MNFEFEPLHIVVDTNRLVNAMTASSKNRSKKNKDALAVSPNPIATTTSDEEDGNNLHPHNIVKRKLYLSGGKRRNVLASLQLNDFKQS